ncbi:MAG: Gfo/Idh/MocA family oxidoreductase [Gemmataceae bacterium]|nr:Gfo/Idh/MocA family oxidoreductase [Gemmataceae bacterium]
MPHKLRIGLIGAGANTRLRHIPGLRALPDVELIAVCNRRPESTAAVAKEFDIPRTHAGWEDVVADPAVDAVVIGTWPYLHCPITLRALEAGKHVLTEARLSMNAAEAHRMLHAARAHPELVTQVVPSPFGLAGHEVMRELLDAGFLGELREVHVRGCNASLADAATPLSWRQDTMLSGYNMLALGILHETVLRWTPPPVRVLAQVHAHIASRIDPQSGVRRPVGTPDSVQVLAVLANGARASYHLSGVTPFGQAMEIQLFGSDGVLVYDLQHDRIRGTNMKHVSSIKLADLPEMSIPPDKARGWEVEAEFVAAIRERTPVTLTDFATAVQYMEFTEAVARSAEEETAVPLPLDEYQADAEES